MSSPGETPTAWTFLREADFATTFTSSGSVPTRTSRPDEIVLWHLANRTLLVDTIAGVVCDEQGRRVERPAPDAYGLIYLGYVAGSARWSRAHRVVWLAAYGPIPGTYVIRQRNGRRWDNRIGNLEMTTKGGIVVASDQEVDDRPSIQPFATSAGRVALVKRRRAAAFHDQEAVSCAASTRAGSSARRWRG